MPKRYNRCYMTSWIIAFMSRRQSRELPTHSYISLKITLKYLPQTERRMLEFVILGLIPEGRPSNLATFTKQHKVFIYLMYTSKLSVNLSIKYPFQSFSFQFYLSIYLNSLGRYTFQYFQWLSFHYLLSIYLYLPVWPVDCRCLKRR